MNPIHAEWLAIDHIDDLHREAASGRLLAAARSAGNERRRPMIDLGPLRALFDAARRRSWPSRAHPVGSPRP